MVAMYLMRGQGRIQTLLAAEQEAQLIVAAATNLKMARLRQAKEEAEREVERHRLHLEYQYQKGISEFGGSADSIEKGLEATEAKIQSLKESTSKASPEIVKMLLKHITTPRT